MRRFFDYLFPRLGRIVIEGDFDLHTRAASKYDDRRVIHLPAFKIWWVQGRVLGRIYQSQYRRPVCPVGRAPVCWAGGREFKPRPDQHPRSYATTSCKNTWDTNFGLIACPWSCACNPPPPLIKVAGNTRPCSKLSETTFEWSGRGGDYYISQSCDWQGLKEERPDFRRSVSTFLQLVVFVTKGDVTRDDSQGRFLAQCSVATLLRHCFEWLQHCSNIPALCCAKHRCCESSRVTSL